VRDSKFLQSNAYRLAVICILVLMVTLCPFFSVSAGEVKTEYEFIIRGTPVPVRALDNRIGVGGPGGINVKPLMMVDDGIRRYFLPKPPAARVSLEAELSQFETFKIPQQVKRTNLQLNNIGIVKELQPVNEFGRKTVQVATPQGPKAIVLAMTEINPFYVQWEAVNLVEWKYAESTTSIPAPVLRQIIDNNIDPNDESDRMAVARFYLQTEQFFLAMVELANIQKNFPAIASEVQSMQSKLQTVWAGQLLRDLEVRQRAGQHQLAMKATEDFLRTIPNLTPEVSQRIREIQTTEKKLSQQLEDARLLLGDLQAKIEDEKLRAEVNTVRMMIVTTLDAEGVSRLNPFLNLAGDASLSAEQKVALAFSGWILGPALANTDLKNTLRQWEARSLILEYFRNTDPTQIASLIERIERSEGIGPSTLIPILENLPALIPTLELKPNLNAPQQLVLETFEGTSNTEPAEYRVLLPIEYSPHRSYPLIVQLRPPSIPSEKAITWWSDQAPRRGYIVIVPEYLDPNKEDYDYSPNALNKIERSLRDAMKRFHIDSDRIYLVGHGDGADAAFDYGMSQAGLFAGVIPISGKCQHHCRWTKNNDPNLSLYAISGEKDRQLLNRNADILNLMMIQDKDIIYAEYMGRGIDDFYEEIHHLFDWMELHRLQRGVKEVELQIVRPGLNRFYWYEINDFPKSLFTNDPIGNAKEVKPLSIGAKLVETSDLQKVYFTKSQPSRVTLWLTPDIFNFDIPLTIRGTLTRKLVDQDVRAMLEDFASRADRKNIARAKIVIE